MKTKINYMPEPSFTADGQYALTSERKRYAAALAVLKCVETMPFAYGQQGPDVVIANIEHTVREFLNILRQAQNGTEQEEPDHSIPGCGHIECLGITCEEERQ